ncbi:MAG TPA: hypothetical protein VI197_26935, partial [Polyangiaceae bacterium]
MRRAMVAVSLGAPFALVLAFAGAVADRQAAGVAEALCQVSQGLSLGGPDFESRDQDEVARWRAELAALLDEPASAPRVAGTDGSQARRSHAAAPVPKGLFVSADKVLRLAQAGARPGGIP